MSGSGGSCVASLILCSTISSSYSSLDPLCYDHQLTGLYLVRQLTINSLLIRQYIQSITSTQTCKVSSLTEVTLTHLVNASSLRRSTDVPTPFHRLATLTAKDPREKRLLGQAGNTIIFDSTTMQLAGPKEWILYGNQLGFMKPFYCRHLTSF